MIRPARYSIPQLAKLWGVDPDQIELFGLEGLTIHTLYVDGDEGQPVRFVAAEDADGFAAQCLAPSIHLGQFQNDLSRFVCRPSRT